MRKTNFISVTTKISEAKATQNSQQFCTIILQHTHYHFIHQSNILLFSFFHFESVDRDKTRNVVLQLKKKIDKHFKRKQQQDLHS